MLSSLSIQAIRCPRVIGFITFGWKVMATPIARLLFLIVSATFWPIYVASLCAAQCYRLYSTVVAPLPKWIIMSSPIALLVLAVNPCVIVFAWPIYAAFALAVAVLNFVAMVFGCCLCVFSVSTMVYFYLTHVCAG